MAGFREHRGTADGVSEPSLSLEQERATRHPAYLVLPDIQRAFQASTHATSLRRHRQYGVCGRMQRYFLAFLCEKCVRFCVPSALSTPRQMYRGVSGFFNVAMAALPRSFPDTFGTIPENISIYAYNFVL